MKRGKFELRSPIGEIDRGKTGKVTTFMGITWYWSTRTMSVKKPNHNCDPDCRCWRKAKRQRDK